MFSHEGGMRRFGFVLAVTALCVGGRPVAAACNGGAANDLIWECLKSEAHAPREAATPVRLCCHVGLVPAPRWHRGMARRVAAFGDVRDAPLSQRIFRARRVG